MKRFATIGLAGALAATPLLSAPQAAQAADYITFAWAGESTYSSTLLEPFFMEQMVVPGDSAGRMVRVKNAAPTQGKLSVTIVNAQTLKNDVPTTSRNFFEDVNAVWQGGFGAGAQSFADLAAQPSQAYKLGEVNLPPGASVELALGFDYPWESGNPGRSLGNKLKGSYDVLLEMVGDDPITPTQPPTTNPTTPAPSATGSPTNPGGNPSTPGGGSTTAPAPGGTTEPTVKPTTPPTTVTPRPTETAPPTTGVPKPTTPGNTGNPVKPRDDDAASISLTGSHELVDRDGSGGASLRDEILWTLQVTNDGREAIKGLTIVSPYLESRGAVISCGSTSLAPGEKTTCIARTLVTQEDVDRGGVTLTARAVANSASSGKRTFSSLFVGAVVTSPTATGRTPVKPRDDVRTVDTKGGPASTSGVITASDPTVTSPLPSARGEILQDGNEAGRVNSGDMEAKDNRILVAAGAFMVTLALVGPLVILLRRRSRQAS